MNNMVAPRVAFGKALVDLADEYPMLHVLDADVCTSTQTHLFREQYPERFIQCGIAEANMVGMAAGMASVGCIPFVSAFAVFLAKRAADQIRVSVAYTNLNVKINAAYVGLPTGRAGATHSSVADMALMRAMPNMTILNPSDAVETAAAVRLALETPGPVYLRTVRCPVPTIFPESYKMELGKGVELMDGKDAAIISTGMMSPKALEAGKLLRKKGINVRVIHMGTIKPLDEEIIVKAARECGRIITVENHSRIGGLGGAVAEVLTEKQCCPLLRIGFPDIFLESGDDEAIFSKMKMNVQDIADRTEGLIKNTD
ncbi:transketolase family protein [Lacrimispora sp.]|uniref:transketolase family protein n=1 Tax=Lacrimispora sp. TaxID=2719234 RepID=UPI002FD958E3